MRSSLMRLVACCCALALALALVLAVPFAARADTINIGQAFGPVIQPFVDTLVQGLLALLVGVVAWAAQKYLNIKFEGERRAALTAWLQRQAQSLVADGFAKVNGLTVTVSSPALAAAVNTAADHIPDALKYFNLSTAQLGQMIVDHVAAVPAIAQAQAIAIDVANPSTPSTAKSSG